MVGEIVYFRYEFEHEFSAIGGILRKGEYRKFSLNNILGI